MYDFTHIPPAVKVSKDWILSKISDSQIFFYYFGRFEIGKSYSSKFSKDNNPSTTFYIGKRGEVLFYDFRSGESIDCFSFIQKAYNCSFAKALETISADFGLIDKKTAKITPKLLEEAANVDKSTKEHSLIQFEPDKWTDAHLAYWRLFEITKRELEKEEVYPVKRLFLNKVEITNFNNHLRFAYKEQYEGGEGVKIYSPMDTKMKWLSSIPLDVPFGLNSLPYSSNIIFVTKSKKDLLILKKIYTDVIASQNESESSLNEDTISLLSRRYDKKVIVWDNDETGVANCKKFNDKGFDYFNIPKEEYNNYHIKDPADYVRAYGLDYLVQLLKNKNLL